mmetsp:Transcript_89886/g.150226  ORF Transcript_89886/g.150226 Transcript_89886/m.150226 type:complete len:208 (-) Transcript_89886:11-634(-)
MVASALNSWSFDAFFRPQASLTTDRSISSGSPCDSISRASRTRRPLLDIFFSLAGSARPPLPVPRSSPKKLLGLRSPFLEAWGTGADNDPACRITGASKSRLSVRCVSSARSVRSVRRLPTLLDSGECGVVTGNKLLGVSVGARTKRNGSSFTGATGVTDRCSASALKGNCSGGAAGQIFPVGDGDETGVLMDRRVSSLGRERGRLL